METVTASASSPVGGASPSRRADNASWNRSQLESLTRQLAAEYADHVIRVNALVLGSIAVPRNATLVRRFTPGRQAVPRYGRDDDNDPGHGSQRAS